MSSTTFSGFPSQTLKFLNELKKHNDREWFQEHKQDYEDHVRRPALEFIESLQVPFKKEAPYLEVVPKKVGGSLMRIYRDTRFSSDKTPYKTNIGMHFKHEAGFDVHAPGCYVHISPEECFIGVGIWQPDADSLRAIRERIGNESAKWKRLKGNAAFQSAFKWAGNSLKRPPQGFPADHPLIEDLKRKDFIVLAELSPDVIESPTLHLKTIELLKTGKPLMRFLCEALELPY